MCEKAILENDELLKSAPDCYKDQELFYPHAIEFVPECFMTQKMCENAVDTYPSTIKFVPE